MTKEDQIKELIRIENEMNDAYFFNKDKKDCKLWSEQLDPIIKALKAELPQAQ